MNQYDQLSLLDEAAGIFKKAATVGSKLIFNDSDYFNVNQTRSFAPSLKYSTPNFVISSLPATILPLWQLGNDTTNNLEVVIE